MWKMCVCVRDKWVHQQTMTLRGRYWEIIVSVSRWKNVNYGPNLKTLQAPLEWLLHSFKKHSLMGTSILVPTVSEVPLTWLCKHNDVPIGIVIQAHAHTHTHKESPGQRDEGDLHQPGPAAAHLYSMKEVAFWWQTMTVAEQPTWISDSEKVNQFVHSNISMVNMTASGWNRWKWSYFLWILCHSPFW